MPENKTAILQSIAEIESRLREIDKEREALITHLKNLKHKLAAFRNTSLQTTIPSSSVNTQSSPMEKIVLFRSLFKGREDVYPKLWTGKKGNKGYSPVCENEWKPGICRKPAMKCGECENRKFSPLTYDVIRRHLDGTITIGVYPMLQDETCRFLALDFDKGAWQDDALAFMTTCKENGVPASLERSRSGNGGHVWIFFTESAPAPLARQFGSLLITRTMEQRHELDMKSYDRLFPNQDTMPKGGFGNLIALPLQKVPRDTGNSVFIDENLTPYSDQWTYLSSIRKMSVNEIQSLIDEAHGTKDIIGIRMEQTDEDDSPWIRAQSDKGKFARLACKLPKELNAILANRIYIKKDNLPSQLLNKIKRLAAFQNPEFYKRQNMRLYTALTPRIICCAETIGDYLTIPRGCLEDLQGFLAENRVSLNIQDKRFDGSLIEVDFHGVLTDLQDKAYRKMLEYETGVLVAPPGIGKTVIAIHLMASRKRNTLVLVHRKPLLEQWRARLSSFLGIPAKAIGHIGGGKDKITGFIDVAMIQSLENRGEVDERVKNYGHIIVDECHHISAVSFERVMMEANARFVTGLTATPYRRDGHQPIISMQCGPVRHHMKAMQEGISYFICKLITRPTDFSCAWSDNDKIHNLWPLLIKDEQRNQLIFDDIMTALEQGRSPIVLTERKGHLEILREKLQNFVKHIIVLHGGMKTVERKAMLAKLTDIPDTEERLILATGPYIGEGFDDPRLDTLFLAMPFSFKGKIVQYAGRLHRPYNGKTEVRVYDYLDRNIPVLQRMYKRRLKAYRALGYVENHIEIQITR